MSSKHRETKDEFIKAQKSIFENETSEAPNSEVSLIFIGGIPKEVSKNDLLEYISEYGQLERFSVPFRGIRKHHKGFAKVLFSSATEMNAFLACPRHVLGNVAVGVSKWFSKFDNHSLNLNPTENKIFFRFKGDINQKDLYQYFSRFGIVESFHEKINYKTNMSKNFGFVTHTNPESALILLDQGLEHVVKGASLLVQLSKSKSGLTKSSNQGILKVAKGGLEKNSEIKKSNSS